jgi:hypothetical protein
VTNRSSSTRPSRTPSSACAPRCPPTLSTKPCGGTADGSRPPSRSTQNRSRARSPRPVESIQPSLWRLLPSDTSPSKTALPAAVARTALLPRDERGISEPEVGGLPLRRKQDLEHRFSRLHTSALERRERSRRLCRAARTRALVPFRSGSDGAVTPALTQCLTEQQLGEPGTGRPHHDLVDLTAGPPTASRSRLRCGGRVPPQRAASAEVRLRRCRSSLGIRRLKR